MQKKNSVQDIFTNAIEETLYLEENVPENSQKDMREQIKENFKFFNNPDDVE